MSYILSIHRLSIARWHLRSLSSAPQRRSASAESRPTGPAHRHLRLREPRRGCDRAGGFERRRSNAPRVPERAPAIPTYRGAEPARPQRRPLTWVRWRGWAFSRGSGPTHVGQSFPRRWQHSRGRFRLPLAATPARRRSRRPIAPATRLTELPRLVGGTCTAMSLLAPRHHSAADRPRSINFRTSCS